MKALRSGIAGVLVAFVVSMGLVVQSSSPAAAFDVGPIVKQGLKKGPTIVGGATLFGRVSNPYGLAITAGQLAWWGYSNRDSISDFLSGGTDGVMGTPEWEDADPNYESPENSSVEGWTSLGKDSDIQTRVVSVVGGTVTLELKCISVVDSHSVEMEAAGMRYQCFGGNFTTGQGSMTTAFTSYPNGERWNCKKSSTGVVTSRTLSTGVTAGISGRNNTGVFTKTFTISPCASGEVLTGFVVPPRNKNQSYQQYGLGWGDLIVYQGLPDGNVTFGGATVTARCKNAVTGETQTLVSDQDVEDNEVVLPSCKQRLGDDWYGTGFTVAPTKPEIDNEPIPDEIEVPDTLPLDWDELIPDEDDPSWQPCYGSKKGCTLDIWIDDKPCDESQPLCRKWTTVKEMDPDRVKCRYGSKVVDAKFCIPLADFYQPGTETGTGTKTETPTTGDTETDTGTGTTTKPPMKDQEGTDAQAECFPSGWGLMNPVEWVYKPVKCALVWAFVPKGDFGLDTLVETIRTRPPGSLVIGVAQVAQSAVVGFTGGGCGTLGEIPLPGPDLSFSCPEIRGMSGYGLVYSGFEALIYGSGIFAVFRMVTGAFRKGSDT